MHSAVREARAAHRCGRRARCEVVVLVRLRLFNLVPSHEGRGPHTRWQSLTPRVKLSCQHWRERCFWRSALGRPQPLWAATGTSMGLWLVLYKVLVVNTARVHRVRAEKPCLRPGVTGGQNQGLRGCKSLFRG